MKGKCLRCGNPEITNQSKLYRGKIVWLCKKCEDLWYKIYHSNPECREAGKWDLYFDDFVAEIKRLQINAYLKELIKKIPDLRFVEYFGD